MPADLPLARSRSEQFEDLVQEVVARLQRRLPERLGAVEVLVADVPPPGGDLRLADTSPASAGRPARVVIYRRPIETRVSGERIRAALLNDLLVEELAALLGVDPESLDPDYGRD
ncbi:MAG: hypothetical protein QOI54_1406 [Actinomycetota bacterium]|nr:hypothetical protein [Actinomycetota bacterium]